VGDEMNNVGGVTVALVLALASFEGGAQTVFADSTFDLANYDTASYQFDLYSPTFADGTTEYSQTLTLGNPGAALRVATTAHSAGFFSASSFLVNKNFVYDPAVSGAISAITIQADLAKTYVPVGFNDGRMPLAPILLAEQHGRYYAGTSVPITYAAPDEFKTVSVSYNVVSLGFLREVVDFATLAENAFSVVNPSSGVIHFGIVVSNSSIPSFTSSDLIDNLSIAVTSIPPVSPAPELPAGELMLLGGSVIAWVSRKRMRLCSTGD
jgi:hypothetical protein